MTNRSTISYFKYSSISALALWLLLFACLPFTLMMLTSFLSVSNTHLVRLPITLSGYVAIFNNDYLPMFLRSLLLSLETVALCLLLGYPFAYILAKLPSRLGNFLMIVMILPFWTSSLIRLYAIIIIIRAKGLLNHFLLSIHLINTPLHLLYSQTAVLIGLVYTLLPFMILPLYANLEKFNWRLLEAAADLGATKWQTFWKVVLPLSLPGIVAGFILVFLPALTLFYIPDTLGGARSLLLGNFIKNQFIEAHNWPIGSAVSVLLTLVLFTLAFCYRQIADAKTRMAVLA